jgi:hypothetical protein
MGLGRGSRRLFWGFNFFFFGVFVGGFFGECKMCFFGCKK